ALADIVKQKRQKKQIGTFESVQDVAEAAFDFAVGGSQRVDVLDRNQGMFIDRVAMVIIANHQGIDRLKFRKQQDQHPQPVHGAQSGAGMRRHQDLPEVRPYLGRIVGPLPQAGKGGFHAALGFGGQLQAMAADEFEKAEQDGG